MPLTVYSPRVDVHRATDGTYTATLYIEGRWYAQMTGFATAPEARRAVRRKYLSS